MSLDLVVLNPLVSDPMKHLSLSTSHITQILGKVVSRSQEHQHEHPTLTHRRPVAARPGGEVVVHQIRMRTAMEEPPLLLPERRIHMVTVARRPPGTLRHERLTHIRMHRLGTLPHARLIRIKMEIKPLGGVPPHGLPTHIRTMNPRTGVTMVAERLRVGAQEDGVVVARRMITRGARRLPGQPTQVTLHG